MRDRYLALVVIGIVAVFWAERFVVASEPLLRGTSDLRNYFYPLYELFYGWVANGRLPLWNPYHIGGYPQLATLQGGFFYPPHLLYVVLPTNVALAISHIAHLSLIAVTTALLMRTIGVGVLGAGLAALVFTLRGAVQWWLLWPAMLEAGAWLPLGCIAVIGLARGRGLRPACWLAFATGMTLLAGHTQVAGFLVWTWATLFAVLVVLEGRGRLAASASFAGALVVGAMLSGIQTAPTFELTLGGTRDIGGISASQVLAMGTGGFTSFADALSDSQFSFGAVALALVPAALFLGRFRAIACWALVLGAVTLAIASISTDAGVEWYRSIPAIGWFRSPRRILFLTNFCVAVLAGIGLEALRVRSDSEAPSPAAAFATLFAALGIAIAGGLQGSIAIAAFGVCVAVAAATLWSGSPSLSGFACTAIVALACVDAGLSGSISGRLPYRAVDAAEYRANADLFAHLSGELGVQRALELPLPRSRDLKLAGRYGLRRLDDFEPLNLRRQSEYFTYFRLGRSVDSNAKRFFAGDVIPELRYPQQRLAERMRDMASRRRLLDLAGARLFFTRPRLGPLLERAAQEFVRAGDLGERRTFAAATITENPHAVDRAFVTYRTRPAPDVDHLLAQLAAPDFDPLAASFVEGGFSLPADNPDRGGPAKIVLDEPEAVEIEAELVADGMVVLADAYCAGWLATVDGEPATILATNHLFRGVAVPAGKHRVRFEYRPASVWVGAATSVAGAALLALGVRRTRSDP